MKAGVADLVPAGPANSRNGFALQNEWVASIRRRSDPSLVKLNKSLCEGAPASRPAHAALQNENPPPIAARAMRRGCRVGYDLVISQSNCWLHSSNKLLRQRQIGDQRKPNRSPWWRQTSGREKLFPGSCCNTLSRARIALPSARRIWVSGRPSLGRKRRKKSEISPVAWPSLVFDEG